MSLIWLLLVRYRSKRAGIPEPIVLSRHDSMYHVHMLVAYHPDTPFHNSTPKKSINRIPSSPHSTRRD
jgi:hypothetical protein